MKKDYWSERCPCKIEDTKCTMYMDKDIILQSDHQREWCIHCIRQNKKVLNNE